MSDGNDTPKMSKTTGAETGAIGFGFLDWANLPAKYAMDFANSGMQMWMTNMAALATMMNPKLLSDSTRMGHFYAIAKHYMPATLFAQMPVVLRTYMASHGVTANSVRQMEEDDLTILVLEAMGSFTSERGVLNKPEYNKKFLAEDSNDHVAGMDPEKIVGLYQRTPGNGFAKPKDYPRLVITASHANAESVNDVTRITHGIEALARDSWNGQELNLAKSDKPITPEQTLILFSCDTRANAMLNGAALTRRVKELRARQADGKPDTFEFMAPGAKRQARLMLACMCENFYDEKTGQPLFDINDLRPLSEIFAGKEGRLRLSPDARRIAQHFQNFGYSKGGNVVSDVMRFMERDLQAVDAQDKGIIRTSKEDTTQDRGILRLKEYGVRSLLRNIDTFSFAARELPNSKHLKDNGVRRLGVNNEDDLLTNTHFYESTPNDEFYVIKGVKKDAGHAPQDMLGTRIDPVLAAQDPQKAAKAARGYALNDARVARRTKEFFAPHYGKAAIANLFLENDALKIESAPGTPDDTMADNREVIVAALERAGLTNPKLVGNPYHIGVMDIQADEDVAHDPAALRKVGAAFKDLRQSAQGLLIAEKIIDKDVDRLARKMNRPVKGKHSARVAHAPADKDIGGRAA